MRRSLLDVLACPECGDRLGVEAVDRRFELDGEDHLVAGVLSCGRGHRFPVLDEVPRLVREADLAADERAVLATPHGGAPRTVPREVVTAERFESELDRLVEAAYELGPGSPPAARRRAASQSAYLRAEYRGENKGKYGRLLASLAVPHPEVVVDVGGSLPGMLRGVGAALGAGRGIVVDLDARFADAFKTAGREFALVRADACALPFAPGAVDLVVSAFVLEHVPGWRRALASMLTVGRRALIAFGPNRWFPFEIGHLDAPLAGTLPRSWARWVAWAWLRSVGRSRPLAGIDKILDEVTYISSREFRRACEALDSRARNVFPDLVDLVAGETGGVATVPRRIVRAWPGGVRAAARGLAGLGLEPQVYYLVEPRPAA